MIPPALSAAHAAVHTWRTGIADTTGPGRLQDLSDEDLGDTYRVLSSLAKDIEDVHAITRDLLVRRLMATKGSTGKERGS